MLTQELEQFVDGWLYKAERIHDDNAEECYEKFFTLFIVFNRLYAAAAFELDRRGTIKLPGKNLPDKRGATEYTLKLIGTEAFDDLYDGQLRPHVEDIIRLMDLEWFNIILGRPHGNRQPEKDRELLARLRSTSSETRALAILELIYQVRCNLFHGHKGVDPMQAELLRPVNRILVAVIGSLRTALDPRYPSAPR